MTRSATSGSGAKLSRDGLDDLLVDGAEDARAVPVEHLDAHGVTEHQEGGQRLAMLDLFQGAEPRERS